jgi:hypothetical protein
MIFVWEISLDVWFKGDLKIKKARHMSKPTSFVLPSSYWLWSHYWGDVDNYESWYKYECCKYSS